MFKFVRGWSQEIELRAQTAAEEWRNVRVNELLTLGSHHVPPVNWKRRKRDTKDSAPGGDIWTLLRVYLVFHCTPSHH